MFIFTGVYLSKKLIKIMNNIPISIEEMKKNTNKTTLILGLDISSTAIGVTLMDSNSLIIDIFAIELNKKNDLIDKSLQFRNEMLKIKDKIGTNKVLIVVEEPLFGSPNPSTNNVLHQFNGICCFILYSIFDIKPIMVSVSDLRKEFCPEFITKKHHKDGTITETLTFPPHLKDKKKEYIHSKVIKQCSNSNLVQYNRNGKLKDTCMDISDSYIVAWYGFKRLISIDNGLD